MRKRIIMVVMALALLMTAVFQGTGNVTAAKITVKKPVITVKKKTKTSVKLSVKSSNKKMTGYKFYKWNGKKYVKTATKKAAKGSKVVSYTFKSLKKNTSYKFKVVAYRTYKGKTYTAFKTKTVKTLNSSSSTNTNTKDNGSDTPDPDDSPVAPESGWEKKMLDKVNEYRREAGVGELVLNQDLCNIALIRCKALIQITDGDTSQYNSYAHFNFTNYFKNYYKKIGLDHYYGCSEVEAHTSSGSQFDNWETLVGLDGWQGSEGHWNNLMKEEWTDFGIANYNGIWYGTLENRNIKKYFIYECE